MFFKVSGKLSENNIIVEITSSGIACKVSCPCCKAVKALSKTKGKNSFSVYNFKSHFEEQHVDVYVEDSLMDMSKKADGFDSDYEIGESSQIQSSKVVQPVDDDVTMIANEENHFAIKMKQLEEALSKLQIEYRKLIHEKTALENSLHEAINIDELRAKLAERGIVLNFI